MFFFFFFSNKPVKPTLNVCLDELFTLLKKIMFEKQFSICYLISFQISTQFKILIKYIFRSKQNGAQPCWTSISAHLHAVSVSDIARFPLGLGHSLCSVGLKSRVKNILSDKDKWSVFRQSVICFNYYTTWVHMKVLCPLTMCTN